jgi:hypothetical protein
VTEAPVTGETASQPSGGYPINVTYDRNQQLNQLWGIPLLGIMARAILAIPHLIILWGYGIVVGLVTLITWYPVLTRGEYPRWGFEIVGGYLRWLIRVQAYISLMADPYPPFTNRAGGYPVDVTFAEPAQLNALWGIPILGIVARAVLAIPHFIILWVLGIVVGVIYLISWFPVLTTGRFPGWGYDIIGGTTRWSTRVTAWIMLMGDPYPPFSLDNPPRS